MIYLFTREQCGPCLIVDKYMNKQSQEVRDKVNTIEISSPDEQMNELLRLYKVQATPTLIVTDPEGVVIERKVGAPHILSSIDNLISYHDRISAK